MKTRTLLSLSVAGLFAAATAFAQNYIPAGTVDSNGNLVIDGQTIAPPAGTVDGSGNLVVGGTTINKPTFTVNEDGSITVDGTTLTKPDLPEGLLSYWMQPLAPTFSDPHYSYIFKFVSFLGGDTNLVYFHEFDFWAYIAANTGTPSTGFWMYVFTGTNAALAASAPSWVYVYPRDVNTVAEGDGNIVGFGDTRPETLNGGSATGGGQRLDGYLFWLNPPATPKGPATDDIAGDTGVWFYLAEYSQGIFMTDLDGDSAPEDYIKVANPVDPSPALPVN